MLKHIYQLEEKAELRFVLDERLGAVKRSQTVIKSTDTVAIAHGGVTYKRGEDLTFLVPDEVAAFYLRQPGWHEGQNPMLALEPEADSTKPVAKPRARRKPAAKPTA